MTEAKIQQDIYIWFTNHYCTTLNKNRCCIFSVPNEAKRSMVAAMQLKRIGLLSGVSDLIVLLPEGVALFVEVKTEVGFQSDNQKMFQQRVELLGFRYYVVRSLKDFQKIIEKSFVIKE